MQKAMKTNEELIEKFILAQRNPITTGRVYGVEARKLNTWLKDVYSVEVGEYLHFTEVDEDVLDEYNNYLVKQMIDKGEDIRRKARTIQRIYSSIRALYSYLVRVKMMSYDPSKYAFPRTTPKGNSIIEKVLKPNQFEHLLDVAQYEETGYTAFRNYLLIFLLGTSAFRISEILEAKWSNVQIIEQLDGTLQPCIQLLRKEGEDRAVGIRSDVYENMLAFYGGEIEPDDDRYIFSTNWNKNKFQGNHPLSPNEARKIVKDIGIKAGLSKKFSPHWLRHTCINDTLKGSNGDIEAVRQLANHKNIKTTQIYLHNLTGLSIVEKNQTNRRPPMTIKLK